MQVHEVSLEIGTDGWICGWALALPGCFWHASSESNAMAKAQAAIEEFLKWLISHGEPVELNATAGVEVVEMQMIPKPLAEGSTGALFGPDQQACDDETLQKALRWMDYSRADLQTVLCDMAPEAWDFQPRGEVNAWTLRNHIKHLANVELYYCLRLVPKLPGQEIPAPDNSLPSMLAFLESTRKTARAFLNNLTREQRASVVLPSWQPGRWAEERWSAHKLLRRFIYHERFHYRDICQLKI